MFLTGCPDSSSSKKWDAEAKRCYSCGYNYGMGVTDSIPSECLERHSGVTNEGVKQGRMAGRK